MSSALNRCQNDLCSWNSFEIPKILHENNSVSKAKPSYSLIPKPDLNTWGHDQVGGQPKTPSKVGSMIPFLRNYWAKLATLEIKGRRTKKYDDIKSFPGVNITRDDSSKQERKEPSKLTIKDSNFEKMRTP